MDIYNKAMTIGQLVDGYQDSGDEGVTTYGGKLNVRPPYQQSLCTTTSSERR